MRFLLCLILSFFFFLSPFQGNASKILSKQSATNLGNYKANLLNYYSISDDYEVANINSNYRKTSTHQCRYYPSNSFINTVYLQNGIAFFYEEKLFAQPHLYCKRIGLKLVFPQHYFW